MNVRRVFLLFCIAVTSFKFIEAVLMPEDEDFFGHTADRYDWSKHPCRRKCNRHDKPKTCNYVFVVEQFSSMGKGCYNCPFNMTDCFRPHCIPADGVQKLLYVVNRQMPGPLIEVCEGDLIEVDVRNQMLSDSTAIHWHGFHQKDTPYMDGVPFVTQCPIMPGQSFKYSYEAVSTGTFFWHSHLGAQRGDGFFGPMVVNPREDKIRALYDYDEHRMLVSEWYEMESINVFTRMFHHRMEINPTNILVNGYGRFEQFKTDNGTIVYTPTAVFKVEKGKKYRFRLIHAGAENCPMEISFDNHTMLVTSLDSSDIVAIEVDWITIWPGERIDFILRANQKPGNYWIRYRGRGRCRFDAVYAINGVFQVAILQYTDVELEDPKEPIGYLLPKSTKETRIFNPFNTGSEVNSPAVNITVPTLTALDPNDESLVEKPDQQLYITFDMYGLDNYDFHRKDLYGFSQVPLYRGRVETVQLNHISLKLPQFPLLSQWDLLNSDSFCNSTHFPKNQDCVKEQCACTHVVQVKLNSTVELIFVDEGRLGVFNHPFHLHGHFFRVISEKDLDGIVTIDRVKQLDKEGKIKRRLNRAPIKDTMKAPGGGYTIVRFYANNPGYWLFHCHFDQHYNIGMALVFKVGEHEDFPEKPKGFPECGKFDSSAM